MPMKRIAAYCRVSTAEEAQVLKNYKQKVKDCTKNIIDNGYIAAAMRGAGIIGDKKLSEETLYDNTAGFSALICSFIIAMNFCLLNHSCCLKPPARYMQQ